MSDEKQPEAPDTPTPQWQYRPSFAINERMKEVIELSVKLTQAEIDRYKEKLRKLTYGA